jgi:hypothetical protein
MASTPVDVVGGQGGFVATANLLEVPGAAAVAGHAGAPAPVVVAPAAPAVELKVLLDP